MDKRLLVNALRGPDPFQIAGILSQDAAFPIQPETEAEKQARLRKEQETAWLKDFIGQNATSDFTRLMAGPGARPDQGERTMKGAISGATNVVKGLADPLDPNVGVISPYNPTSVINVGLPGAFRRDAAKVIQGDTSFKESPAWLKQFMPGGSTHDLLYGSGEGWPSIMENWKQGNWGAVLGQVMGAAGDATYAVPMLGILLNVGGSPEMMKAANDAIELMKRNPDMSADQIHAATRMTMTPSRTWAYDYPDVKTKINADISESTPGTFRVGDVVKNEGDLYNLAPGLRDAPARFFMSAPSTRGGTTTEGKVLVNSLAEDPGSTFLHEQAHLEFPGASPESFVPGSKAFDQQLYDRAKALGYDVDADPHSAYWNTEGEVIARARVNQWQHGVTDDPQAFSRSIWDYADVPLDTIITRQAADLPPAYQSLFSEGAIKGEPAGLSPEVTKLVAQMAQGNTDIEAMGRLNSFVKNLGDEGTSPGVGHNGGPPLTERLDAEGFGIHPGKGFQSQMPAGQRMWRSANLDVYDEIIGKVPADWTKEDLFRARQQVNPDVTWEEVIDPVAERARNAQIPEVRDMPLSTPKAMEPYPPIGQGPVSYGNLLPQHPVLQAPRDFPPGSSALIKGYHGTPAPPFQAFDPEKIGSGQGAQSFTYGHYIAEEPKVGEDYFNSFQGHTNTGQPPTVMRVDVNANPEDFLNFDLPIAQQPQSVQNALRTRGINPDVYQNQSDMYQKGGWYNDLMDTFNDHSPLADARGDIEWITSKTGMVVHSPDTFNPAAQDIIQLLRDGGRQDLADDLTAALSDGKEVFSTKARGMVDELPRYLSHQEQNRAATQWLADQTGFKGVSYLDQNSRLNTHLQDDLARQERSLASGHDDMGMAIDKVQIKRNISNLKKAIAKGMTHNYVVWPGNEGLMDIKGASQKSLEDLIAQLGEKGVSMSLDPEDLAGTAARLRLRDARPAMRDPVTGQVHVGGSSGSSHLSVLYNFPGKKYEDFEAGFVLPGGRFVTRAEMEQMVPGVVTSDDLRNVVTGGRAPTERTLRQQNILTRDQALSLERMANGTHTDADLAALNQHVAGLGEASPTSIPASPSAATPTPRMVTRGGEQRYVGAPPGINTPETEDAMVQRLLDRALSPEGIAGAPFYTDYQNAIRANTSGPQQATNLAILTGHTSPQSTPLLNHDWAVRGLNQNTAGMPIDTGAFHNANRAKIEQSLREGTLSIDPKTGQYTYHVLPEEMRPEGYQDVLGRTNQPVHDTWEIRAFGYTPPGGKVQASATGPQHLYMDRIYAERLIPHLNSNPETRAMAPGGQGWNVENTQAAIWASERAAAEKFTVSTAGQIIDTAKGITQMAGTPGKSTSQIGAIPGTSTGGDLTQVLINSPPEVQAEWINQVMGNLADESGANIIARTYGLSSPMTPGYGPWQGRMEPNRIIDIGVGSRGTGAGRTIDPASELIARTVRRQNQVALGQEASGLTVPYKTTTAKDANLARLEGVPIASQQDYEGAFAAAEKVFGPGWDGKVVVQRDPVSGNMLLKNISGSGGAEFIAQVKKFSAEIGQKVKVVPMRDTGNQFDYARWDISPEEAARISTPDNPVMSYRSLLDETRDIPAIKARFDEKVIPALAGIQDTSEAWAKEMGVPANTVPDRLRRIIVAAGADWPAAIEDAVKKGVIPVVVGMVALQAMQDQDGGPEGTQVRR